VGRGGGYKDCVEADTTGIRSEPRQKKKKAPARGFVRASGGLRFSAGPFEAAGRRKAGDESDGGEVGPEGHHRHPPAQPLPSAGAGREAGGGGTPSVRTGGLRVERGSAGSARVTCSDGSL